MFIDNFIKSKTAVNLWFSSFPKYPVTFGFRCWTWELPIPVFSGNVRLTEPFQALGHNLATPAGHLFNPSLMATLNSLL